MPPNASHRVHLHLRIAADGRRSARYAADGSLTSPVVDARAMVHRGASTGRGRAAGRRHARVDAASPARWGCRPQPTGAHGAESLASGPIRGSLRKERARSQSPEAGPGRPRGRLGAERSAAEGRGARASGIRQCTARPPRPIGAGSRRRQAPGRIRQRPWPGRPGAVPGIGRAVRHRCSPRQSTTPRWPRARARRSVGSNAAGCVAKPRKWC